MHIFIRVSVFLLMLVAVSKADLTNGSFSQGGNGLAGWTIDDPFLGGASEVSVGGLTGAAVLGEGDGSTTPSGFLSQTFTLANDPLSLSFEFEFASTAGGPTDPARFFDDFMNVALFKTGAGDLFTDPFGFATPVFLTFDRNGVLDNIGGGDVGAGSGLSNRYELDLTGLGLMGGDELTLSFLMLPSEDGFASSGLIDNVSVTAIPAPASIVLAIFGIIPAASVRRRKSQA